MGGFYGEFSPNLDRLVKAAAQKGAELHASKYGLANGDKIQSVLANKIRTNWAMALARENAHVKIANVRWVRGAGFEEARCDAEADLHTSWMAWEDLQNCPRPLNSMAAHLATSLREKCGWIVDQ